MISYLFDFPVKDQLVNMNVGVPKSFLILFALRGDLATAPCLSQTTGDHFPFGFKAFFENFEMVSNGEFLISGTLFLKARCSVNP